MKKVIYGAFVTLAAVAASVSVTSCEDMLKPDSDLVVYPEEYTIDTPSDSTYSMVGIFHLLQKVADRTVVLGDVRSDLTSLTAHAGKDLMELASFGDISKDNIYNQPQDYYAIINNCNYFIENADSTYKKQGVKVFEKELAAIHTFRAWAYLQLVTNYGEVPYYTEFLGTQLAGEEVMKQPKKGIKEVCNLLIDDLLPWQQSLPPAYLSADYFIPVRLMLGELCLWAERYEEAAQWYHDYLTDVRNPEPIVTELRYLNWSWTPGDPLPSEPRISGLFGITSLADILMESSIMDGTISQLSNLYSSTQDNYYYYEIFCSESAKEQSAAQSVYKVVVDTELHRDTIKIGPDSILSEMRNVYALGDLRLWYVLSLDANPNSESTKFNDERLINAKYSSTRTSYIRLYRDVYVYLHFAEALNRAGFPTAAFAILKYGLCEKNTLERAGGDPISAEERAKAGTLLDFDPQVFTEENTMGLHARGCGDDVDANPEYVIPAGADTIQWVEDRIFEESALEGIFEGWRYYDLIRLSLRRGDNSILADAIAKRNGKDNVDTSLRSKLMDSKNWFLPLQK